MEACSLSFTVAVALSREKPAGALIMILLSVRTAIKVVLPFFSVKDVIKLSLPMKSFFFLQALKSAPIISRQLIVRIYIVRIFICLVIWRSLDRWERRPLWIAHLRQRPYLLCRCELLQSR